MGEWDAGNFNEPIPYQEYTVARIFVHPSYSATSLSNSIAILRLSPMVPLGAYPSITTGCLATSFITGLRCWVSGWGANGFSTGSAQFVQTHVDIPLVDQASCLTKLRTTKLGSNFVLDNNSFLCAGGESGKGKKPSTLSVPNVEKFYFKDACTGDGGAPLVCPVAGKFYVVGLVAWGIGESTRKVQHEN